MQLVCDQLGKRYNRHWVFRNLSRSFGEDSTVGLVGNNGSGKSTLLKVLAGYERFSEGSYTVEIDGKKVDENSVYRHIALCAPYQNLYEDFTLKDHYELHVGFKKMRIGSFNDFHDLIALEGIGDKALKYYSSGMRQRVKLALAILSDTPMLFLDEPVSNLDSRSTLWYRELVAGHIEGRAVFVASNKNEDELFFCHEFIDITDLK